MAKFDFKSASKKIPIALLNARLTKKTFKRWILILKSAKKFLGYLICVYVQIWKQRIF